MKNLSLIVAVLGMVPLQVAAQTNPSDETADATRAKPESLREARDDGGGPYSSKVMGRLWFDFLIGTSWFDPDQYRNAALSNGSALNTPRQFGPEWGVAIGGTFRGFHLGASYRRGKYDGYKLLKVGVDMKGIFRFVPYVHPMLRLNVYYASVTDGNPYPQLTNVAIDGGGFTLGAGFMVPIVRWLSFTTTFDWSVMGFALRGNEVGGERVRDGLVGQELGVSFAVTFHFIGVRGD